MTELPVGLIGARRRRNGLGPYLARFFEQAGATVTAVAGASRERAEAAARELAADLGHEVLACADPAELCGSGIAALVIASPAPFHLEALEAALTARLPVLCEKPLVTLEHRVRGERLVAGYRDADLLLMENCQWPYTLDALWALHPDLRGEPVAQVEMGLSPAAPGRAMVEDSLSHFLSLLQALLPVGPDSRATDVDYSDRSAEARAITLRLTLRGRSTPVRGRLELSIGPSQPRPAWLAVNGRRMDRRILGPGYRLAFEAEGRTRPIDDPMAALVYGFVGSIREPHIERVRTESENVVQRLRLYCEILDRWNRPAG